MSDILCSWVNYDVQLKVRVNRDSLGNQFRSGYLFGEILHRYGHINTDMFGAMQDAKSNEAAIRNFTLLRSIFDELQIKVKYYYHLHLYTKLYFTVDADKNSEHYGKAKRCHPRSSI